MNELLIIMVLVVIILWLLGGREGCSHISPYYYPSDYIAQCECKNKKCNNSRCIYSTLDECKKTCSRQCNACPGGGYECVLNSQ